MSHITADMVKNYTGEARSPTGVRRKSKMLLTADMGNTNIVFTFYEGEEPVFSGRCVTDPLRSQKEYSAEIKAMMTGSGVELSTLEGSVISSVVPSLTGTISDVLEELTGAAPMVIDADMDTGVTVGIGDKHELGNDLLVAAVAAVQKYPLPMVIADVGTATTFSVIDGEGVFRGVIICPGPMLGYRALTAGAEQLQAFKAEAPDHVIGSNTRDSLMAGLFFGNADILDGMAGRIEEELGEKASLIATGGLASSIIPHCRRGYVLDEGLVPEGIRAVFYRNRH